NDNSKNIPGDIRVRSYDFVDGRVVPGSAREILRVEKEAPNHNGGQLVFGPDGMLYIGVGMDGISLNPQSKENLLGKVLRIDVLSGKAPYAVPTDNPFVDEEGARPEIWTYGLKNPWRFS